MLAKSKAGNGSRTPSLSHQLTAAILSGSRSGAVTRDIRQQVHGSSDPYVQRYDQMNPRMNESLLESSRIKRGIFKKKDPSEVKDILRSEQLRLGERIKRKEAEGKPLAAEILRGQRFAFEKPPTDDGLGRPLRLVVRGNKPKMGGAANLRLRMNYNFGKDLKLNVPHEYGLDTGKRISQMGISHLKDNRIEKGSMRDLINSDAPAEMLTFDQGSPDETRFINRYRDAFLGGRMKNNPPR
jgi:hypothetical protein